jgi:hypothetical protein
MRRHFVLTTAVLLAASGCIDTACTLIGCVSGLFIQFDKAPEYPYRVELTTGGSTTRTFLQECPSSAKCGPGMAYFPDYFPSAVTITVTTPSGTVTKLVEPTYQESYPNGRGCGPACKSAQVTMALP